MKQVEQISIFLASPNDVLAERNYVEEVIAELNRTIARILGMNLRVVRYEKDAYPAYGQDAQAIIIAQLGPMSEYDLCVFAMWNRVGTSTPRADSGTLEEFELATQALALHGQPEIWLYFREAGSSEQRTIEEIEQQRKVGEFRERVEKIEKQCLSRSYSTPEEFRDMLRVQLFFWLERRAKGDRFEAGRECPEATVEEPSTVNRHVAAPASHAPLREAAAGKGRLRSFGHTLLASLLKRFDLSRQGQGIETSALIALVNGAVTKSNRRWLILGAIALGTTISAVRITDYSFLLRKTLLPLVSAPLFLCLAPLLILGAHLWLMFTEYDLLRNLTRSKVKAGYFATSLCRYFPADYGFPAGFAVQAAFWTAFFLGPVGVLLYLQICSLRFRDATISKILVFCTVIDLLALGAFIALGWMVKWSNRGFWWGGSRWKRTLSSLAPAAYSAFLALFSVSYAELLDDPGVCIRSPERFWGMPVRRYVGLSRSSLAKEGAPSEIAEADLAGLDLRCADFTEARFPKANFAGTILWGAIFDHADLRGANGAGARLRHASLVGADLTKAVLPGADLRETDLHGAILQEADLKGADLTGASAFGANLIAADLTRAHLRLGDFRQAQLDYALLEDARMELARFDEAGLDRVLFRGAAALGASFRHASLRGAEGLALQGVDLRRALVFGLNSCGAPVERFPALVDLRDLDYTPVEWGPLWMNLRRRVNSPLGSETLDRVVEAPSTQKPGESACFSNISLPEIETRRDHWADILKRYGILYGHLPAEPFFEEWPLQSSLTEEEFLGELAGALIQKACDELSRPMPGESGDLSLRVLLDRRAEEIDRFGMLLRSRLAAAPCPPPRSSGS